MNNSYFPKLAISNLRKNKQAYFPYLIACIATIMMFFIMDALTLNKDLEQVKGGMQMLLVLDFGTKVIEIFSVIILFYTNSFLMKRRKKEIGLYNILGMEKKHLGIMMAFETFFIYMISVILGLLFGVLLYKLSFLILLKILHFEMVLTSRIPLVSILHTALLFACIFVITFIFNLLQIHLAKPVELLSSANTGEKEPKEKKIMTIVGLITLLAGYIMANRVEDPIKALPTFFIAILLVIVGTYALFTSGSITFLKILKKKKNYYYQTKHFISISSMIYRMKQNAVGLASICILSTAVLLTLSTTVSMYCGMDSILTNRFPRQFSIYADNASPEAIGAVAATLDDNFDTYELQAKDVTTYQYKDTYAIVKDSDFDINDVEVKYDSDFEHIAIIEMIPLTDYNNLTGNNVSLKSDEMLTLQLKKDFNPDTITINGDEYKNAGSCKDLPITDNSLADYYNTFYMVFANPVNILTYSNISNQATDTNMDYSYSFDMEDSADPDVVYDFSVDTKNTLQAMEGVSAESRDEAKDDFFITYGSLFFIGIFLGVLFLGATVLIIYYKQVSEGFDDRERYKIMEKVGLSKHEIKQTIHSQIIKIFFLPIVMAIIHICFAFQLMIKLLRLMGLCNVTLFAVCTGITVVIFAIIYCAIYLTTANAYYKIVN